MRRATICRALLLGTLLVAGCFEGKGDFTLNGDGSGKVAIDLTFPLASPWTGPKKAPPRGQATGAAAAAPAAPPTDVEADAKAAVSAILSKSSGIDAWKDIAYEQAGHGRIRFRGTAYFRDLSAVRIFPDDLKKSRASFAREADGLVLVLSRLADDGPARGSSGLGGEELAERLREERQRYGRAKAQIALDLASLRMDLLFHLPAVPVQVEGLAQQGADVSLAVEGTRVLQAMDALISDNAYLARMIASGDVWSRDAARLERAVSERIFAQRGGAWARIAGPFRQQFDYEAEVAAARAAFPDIVAKLGLDVKAPRTPAKTDARPPARKPEDSPPKKPGGPASKSPPAVPMPRSVPAVPAPILPF